MELINKAAVVAEIEKQGTIQPQLSWFTDKLIQIINDSVEVKEVDLEKELSYEDYIGFFKKHPNFSDDWGFDEAWIFAKYFFELGLKAQKGE